jgi:hypothetical protein
MSRRIVFVFATAACAALIAGPSAADRECFESSCRMPVVVEPPAEVIETPAEPNERPLVVDVVPPGMDARATPPVRTQPQMIVDPAERRYVEPATRQPLAPRPQPVRQAAAPPAPAPDEPLQTIQVVRGGTSYTVAQPAPAYAMGQGALHSGVVVAAAPLYPEDGMMSAYPYMRPDPAWRLCQIDGRGGDQRYHCGPYSYHPFGLYGQRPMGTYRAPRGGAVYVQAPDARIITLDTAD